LIGNGVGFRPLGKVVHSDQEVSVSLAALWEGLCCINGYSFERGPMNLAPIPGSGAATGCTGVALPAPFLNIGSCLEPVVPLPDLIQSLVDTQVTPVNYMILSHVGGYA
jgi:hypothetical protein